MMTYLADQTLNIVHVVIVFLFFLPSTVFWYLYGPKFDISAFLSCCYLLRHDPKTCQLYSGIFLRRRKAVCHKPTTWLDVPNFLSLESMIYNGVGVRSNTSLVTEVTSSKWLFQRFVQYVYGHATLSTRIKRSRNMKKSKWVSIVE